MELFYCLKLRALAQRHMQKGRATLWDPTADLTNNWVNVALAYLTQSFGHVSFRVPSAEHFPQSLLIYRKNASRLVNCQFLQYS